MTFLLLLALVVIAGCAWVIVGAAVMGRELEMDDGDWPQDVDGRRCPIHSTVNGTRTVTNWQCIHREGHAGEHKYDVAFLALKTDWEEAD